VVLGRVDNKKFPSEQAQLQSLASIWEPFATSGKLCIGTSALRKFLEEQQEEHVKAQMPKLKAAVSSRHRRAYDDAHMYTTCNPQHTRTRARMRTHKTHTTHAQTHSHTHARTHAHNTAQTHTPHATHTHTHTTGAGSARQARSPPAGDQVSAETAADV
jgi:hypothetical protein